jgi:hypothetical protein
MNNRKRDKQKRQRLSLQNRDLVRNQLNLVIENIKREEEEEREVTKEEDQLKYFSKKLRKKEKEEERKRKEEERKKYLHPIKEEEDPLKFFEHNTENKDETELDPLKYVKKSQEINADINQEPKVLGELALHDEEKLAEAIKNNDIPEEIIVNKHEDERSNSEEKKKRFKTKLVTALRLSSQRGLRKRLNDQLLLQRVKGDNNVANAEDAIKQSETGKVGGNTLLGADEQVNPTDNTQTIKEKKQIDLGNYMKKLKK